MFFVVVTIKVNRYYVFQGLTVGWWKEQRHSSDTVRINNTVYFLLNNGQSRKIYLQPSHSAAIAPHLPQFNLVKVSLRRFNVMS
jgi:hypothetical protein